MLIKSPRHTQADLWHWLEISDGDSAWGKSPKVRQKAEQSIAEIRRFAAEGPCYTGVSWGKDSCVLAHLVSIASPKIPLVWVRWPVFDNPDSCSVCKAFPGISNMPYREVLSPDMDNDDGRIGFAMAVDVAGTNRRITGLRAQESRTRKVSMSHIGLSTDRSCRPLGWWTAADVFGYLAANRLPVHPVYAMNGGGRWAREQIRVDSLGGERGNCIGRAEWEREYYSDVLNRL